MRLSRVSLSIKRRCGIVQPRAQSKDISPLFGGLKAVLCARRCWQPPSECTRMMDANGRPRLITDPRDLLERVSPIPLLVDPVLE